MKPIRKHTRREIASNSPWRKHKTNSDLIDIRNLGLEAKRAAAKFEYEAGEIWRKIRLEAFFPKPDIHECASAIGPYTTKLSCTCGNITRVIDVGNKKLLVRFDSDGIPFSTMWAK